MARSEKKKGFLGDEYIEHRDDAGQKTGESREKTGFFGDKYTESRDADGNQTAESRKKTGFFGDQYIETRDASGQKTGESRKRTGFFGDEYIEHRDAAGNKTGESHERTGLFGNKYTERIEASPSRSSSGSSGDEWDGLIKLGFWLAAVVFVIWLILMAVAIAVMLSPIWLGAVTAGVIAGYFLAPRVLGRIPPETMDEIPIYEEERKKKSPRLRLADAFFKAAVRFSPDMLCIIGAAVLFGIALAAWPFISTTDVFTQVLLGVGVLTGGILGTMAGRRVLHWQLENLVFSTANIKEPTKLLAPSVALGFSIPGLIILASMWFLAVFQSSGPMDFARQVGFKTETPPRIASTQRGDLDAPPQRESSPPRLKSPEARTSQQSSSPISEAAFRKLLHDNMIARIDETKGEFVVELDWMARLGAARWEAPVSALAFDATTVGETVDGGAFRDSTLVRIPIRSGNRVFKQQWQSDPDVEAPWKTSVPPQSEEYVTDAIELYARGPREAVALKDALRQIAPPKIRPDIGDDYTVEINEGTGAFSSKSDAVRFVHSLGAMPTLPDWVSTLISRHEKPDARLFDVFVRDSQAEWIAFRMTAGDWRDNQGAGLVYVARLDGQDLRLIHDSGMQTDRSLLPSCVPLGFVGGDLLISNGSTLSAVSLDGGSIRLIASDAWMPALSPDSRLVAYMSSHRTDGGANLSITALRDGRPRTLTAFEGRESGYQIKWISGEEIAFEMQNEHPGDIETWTVNADGTRLRKLGSGQIGDLFRSTTADQTEHSSPSAAIEDFIRSRLEIEATHDLDRILASHADRVNYWNNGVVDRDFIRKDKAAYFERWPVTREQIEGPISVTKNGDDWIATFKTRFRVENSDKGVSIHGIQQGTYTLREVGDSFQIVAENGEVLEKQKIEIPQTAAPQTGNFPGEKFPQTRTVLLQPQDLRKFSADDLRYAINEMFARHGADFAKAEIKRHFQQFSWYRPRPGLDFDQIENDFSDVERVNIKFLGAARDAKAAGKPL